MGEVVKLKVVTTPDNGVGAPLAFASEVQVGRNVFNVVVERDIECDSWTWRAFAYVGHTEDIAEDGTHSRLLLTLQEEPTLLYTSPTEAHDKARQTLLAFSAT
jgi:hypothetical protein